MKYIFLHGLGQSPESWKAVREAMDAKRDICCPDLSEWLFQKEPCYTNLYCGLEKFCELLEEPFNLCGLSLGGMLALQYTAEHPDKVNSLVLIGTQFQMPKKLLKLQNFIFRMMPNSAFANTGFGKSELIRLSQSMMDLNFKSDLKKILCPVLVLCGEKDRANRRASLQLKELLSHAEIAFLSKAGHEVNADAPAALAEQMELFFKEQKE